MTATSGKLWLVRDRFGIKPLYYAQRWTVCCDLPRRCQRCMAAGGIDTEIDRAALHHYMTWHSVVPAPRTIVKGVRKLAGRHDPHRGARRQPARDETYWRPDFTRTAGGGEPPREHEWEEMLLEALRLAVKRRMVADVPVGVLLSGGVDSSLIVGLLGGCWGRRGLPPIPSASRKRMARRATSSSTPT